MVSAYIIGGVAGLIGGKKIVQIADKISARLQRVEMLKDFADADTVLMGTAVGAWYMSGTIGDGIAAACAVSLITKE